MIESLLLLPSLLTLSLTNNELDLANSTSVFENEIIQSEINNRDSGDSNLEHYLRPYILENLTSLYNDYSFISKDLKLTNQSSGAIPINIQGPLLTIYEIENVINNPSNMIESSYGGCGPLAMMGIFDYFARYLGYTEIMDDPTDIDCKYEFIKTVLQEVQTYEVGWIYNTNNATATFPWDYCSAFNHLSNNTFNVDGSLTASYDFTVFGGKQDEYWSTIVNNINKGLPVTLMANSFSNRYKPFAEHYFNIVGYEIFRGINTTTNEIIDFPYIIARLNYFGSNSIYYCNADILNDPMISLITYDLDYSITRIITANNFANDFINNSGGGQYFFYNIDKTVWITDTYRINTSRLRCSYIENEYLVLSPKRQGAGTSYLEIVTMHQIQKLSFESALWSPSEGHDGLSFKIQYMDDDEWVNHVEIDMQKISKYKNIPDNYNVLFPKHVHRFRFLITHNNPTGNYNRGRTILDNIIFKFNSET